MRAWRCYFPPRGSASDPTEHTHIFQNPDLIVGMHPDQVTEAIVDYALSNDIPFAVVPCCVFARLFPHRRFPRSCQQRREDGIVICDEVETSKNRPEVLGRDEVEVRTHADLVRYLKAKHPAIREATLDFQGMNTVLWWDKGDAILDGETSGH